MPSASFSVAIASSFNAKRNSSSVKRAGGAFLAPLVCGYLGETYGYRYGFLAAGIGMMLGQIMLAWYLMPADFGMIGLALTVSGFAGLAQQTGAREILIRRQANFRRWVTPAFWMSLSAGLLSTAT